MFMKRAFSLLLALCLLLCTAPALADHQSEFFDSLRAAFEPVLQGEETVTFTLFDTDSGEPLGLLTFTITEEMADFRLQAGDETYRVQLGADALWYSGGGACVELRYQDLMAWWSGVMRSQQVDPSAMERVSQLLLQHVLLPGLQVTETEAGRQIHFRWSATSLASGVLAWGDQVSADPSLSQPLTAILRMIGSLPASMQDFPALWQLYRSMLAAVKEDTWCLEGDILLGDHEETLEAALVLKEGTLLLSGRHTVAEGVHSVTASLRAEQAGEAPQPVRKTQGSPDSPLNEKLQGILDGRGTPQPEPRQEAAEVAALDLTFSEAEQDLQGTLRLPAAGWTCDYSLQKTENGRIFKAVTGDGTEAVLTTANEVGSAFTTRIDGSLTKGDAAWHVSLTREESRGLLTWQAEAWEIRSGERYDHLRLHARYSDDTGALLLQLYCGQFSLVLDGMADDEIMDLDVNVRMGRDWEIRGQLTLMGDFDESLLTFSGTALWRGYNRKQISSRLNGMLLVTEDRIHAAFTTDETDLSLTLQRNERSGASVRFTTSNPYGTSLRSVLADGVLTVDTGDDLITFWNEFVSAAEYRLHITSLTKYRATPLPVETFGLVCRIEPRLITLEAIQIDGTVAPLTTAAFSPAEPIDPPPAHSPVLLDPEQLITALMQSITVEMTPFP